MSAEHKATLEICKTNYTQPGACKFQVELVCSCGGHYAIEPGRPGEEKSDAGIRLATSVCVAHWTKHLSEVAGAKEAMQ